MFAIKKIINSLRVLWHRIGGAHIQFRVKVGRHFEHAGEVSVGEGTEIESDVRMRGKVKIGRNCLIQRGASLSGNVEIGDKSVVGAYTIISTMPDAVMKIGDDVIVNSFSNIGAGERVEIKDHCIFASYVQITDAAHGFEDSSELIKHAEWSTAPVVIERNVWLGSAVMVMKGVTIGEGSVIGAKALVNRDIPPMSVAFGIPASVKRKRAPGETVNAKEELV